MKRKLIIISIILFGTIIVAMLVLNIISRMSPKLSDEIITDTIAPPVNIKMEFGIPVDSFIIENGKIKKNQVITDLLRSYGVPDSHLNAIHINNSGIINFKNIRSGNKYKAFLSKDSLKTLKYLIYEHNPLEFYIFENNDSLTITHKFREVDTIQKTAIAKIEASLWQTMKSNNLNPLLAIMLSEMYAWSIDFFGLQKGDEFKVVYEEIYVDSVSIGIPHIYAAYFKHNGQEYYAFPFIQDGRQDYYDENGNSLKKAFLKAPLRFSRISSRYSNSRFHPVLRIWRPHHGVDYAAPYGTPVHSVGNGKVIAAGFSGGAGRMIKIKHNGTFTTGYMHLSHFANGIHAGSSVSQGEVIGYVGSSGIATGPHLDFRFWMNNQPVNPLKVIAPPSLPIKFEDRPLFETIKICYFDMLQNIKLPN